MQVVGWKQPPIAMQLVDGWDNWPLTRKHASFFRKIAALGQITGRTSSHHIIPRGLATARTRDHMIKGQIIGRVAILAHEFIAQENVKPREGRRARGLHIVLQRNDAGKFKFSRRTMHHPVIFRHDVNPV